MKFIDEDKKKAKKEVVTIGQFSSIIGSLTLIYVGA
jgi:hypothetical protein